MTSLILITATRYLLPLMIIFSVFLLTRGHNEPGGGFVGGLVAASAVALYGLAHGADVARRLLRVNPIALTGAGMLVAGGSGMAAVAAGAPFMAGRWVEVAVPTVGRLYLGTPVLFDVGVYLVVVGATLTVILSLAEE
jgi:multicomponent Na+:H+ antiporter subunit B